MICSSQRIRRKIKPSNKVSRSFLVVSHDLTNIFAEAAIDANAPLEDEEAANGPLDSDEELMASMTGLSNWHPQPLVPPVIQIPIERQYMRERLREQLSNATNGFTMNIFKVVGIGAQKLPPGMVTDSAGDVDAEGDLDLDGLGRRPSTFNLQLPASRRPSVVGRA